jgi:molybdopterin molybdotransferase
MAEFFNVIPPQEALLKLEKYLKPLTRRVEVDLDKALGRITAEAVYAPHNLPAFARSTMDGYAVRAADSYGASEGLPAYFKLSGEMPMGQAASIHVGKGEAVKIHTGGMLPELADAVAMIENTQMANDSTIELVRAVAPGENILRVGDDIKTGALLLEAGHLIRPQDIGGLAALGITVLKVYDQPGVGILSTGDEIIPAGQSPRPGQVRDINSYTLAALVRQAGGIALPQGIAPDNLERLKSAAATAFAQSDVLVISAGSSVSTRDMTARVIAELGSPGILVYGVAIRPGKPVIIAMAGDKPVFGLPGNPVSAAITFDLFVRPAILRVGGCPHPPKKPRVMARLTHNIPSTTGREDYVPVKLEWRNGELLASPIFGESNLITTLVRADGLAVVPLDMHGLNEGEMAQIREF